MNHPRHPLFLALGLALAGAAQAGNLDSSAPPSDPASGMYTLESLYQRLDTGATGSKRAGAFEEPAAGPAATGYTLDQIMAAMPAVDDANGATAGEVLQGKTFWGLRSDGAWGLTSGSLASQAIDNTQTSQAAGNYAVFDLATEDTDLTSANIKSGANIFGITGKAEVVDTSEATNAASAADLLSGKVAFVNGAALTGTVVAGANVTGPNGQLSFTIPNGLYTGNKTCTAADSNLAAGNIKSGTTIFGTSGSYSCTAPTGTALAADVLSGKTFSNASGTGISGAMVNVGAQSILPGTTQQTITQGYHDGTGSVKGDADLITGNIKSGATIFGIAGDPNVVDTSSGDALAAEILSGKKAWVAGSEITGSMPTQTLSDTSTSVAAGYYAATDLATVDSDLTDANIKSGANIFGVTGSYPLAGVPKTGQTKCYDTAGAEIACTGTKQDGELQVGIAPPSPRFTINVNDSNDDNNNGICDGSETCNGTVTDNLTGLIWLTKANCIGTDNSAFDTDGTAGDGRVTWDNAFTFVTGINAGTYDCGDTSNSGSHQTDWRLPNVKELQSLIDFANVIPALTTGHPFSGVQTNLYWSATSFAGNPSGAWVVVLYDGFVGAYGKASSYYVWPVRAGQ